MRIKPFSHHGKSGTSATSGPPAAPGAPSAMKRLAPAAPKGAPQNPERTRPNRPNPILSKFQTPAIRTLGWISLTALALTAYAMTAGRLVLNGSDSLTGGAFYILAAPKIYARGAVVAFDAPARVRDRFDGLVFVKRIWGLPGDEIRETGAGPCIKTACYPLLPQSGAGAAAIRPGRIPPGHIAVIGETETSLDSRYAVIGLIPKSDVIGTGFAIPYLPNWTVIDRWVRS